MTERRILVTAALPYANGPIHLGHVAGVYLPADIYVRYQRLRGRDILYICGSDEFGVPITLTAEKEGVTPQEIVDRYHNMNLESFQTLGISFDQYSRTTAPIHKETAQDIFTVLHGKGNLKEKHQQQLYCESCSRYLPDRFVEGTCPHCQAEKARGDQCDTCGKWIDQVTLVDPGCKICGNSPVIRETSHWFLPLGDHQDWLSEWFSSATTQDWRENVLNFCRGWFAEGLEDRAVTRDLGWGVPVPLEDHEGKVLYVWFDAPIGYISATKEYAQAQNDPDLWKKYWCTQDDGEDPRLIHFIGKDNIVFHAIFFPVMMQSYGGYVLPDFIPANEYLTLEGRKISTSENYAVWLKDYLAAFKPDPLRYCLTAIAPETRDADFSWKDFQSRNNYELADIIGNFINRSLAFAKRYFDGVVPTPGELENIDRDFVVSIRQKTQQLADKIDAYRFRDAQREMMDLARDANKYFNDSEPWKTVKDDTDRCATTLYHCMQAVCAFHLLMEPFLPESAEKLRSILNVSLDLKESADFWAWGANTQLDADFEMLPAGHTLGEAVILFPKIEDSDIAPEVERLKKIAGAGAAGEAATDEPEKTPAITYDQFMETELRVATIKTAERIPNADRLLRLIVDDGEGDRQIVAGIAEHYDPEQLPGMQVIIVVNLAPAKIRGVESNGMLLAAKDKSGLAVVTPAAAKEPGSRVS
jgi:methionyl-tRNA synthetase